MFSGELGCSAICTSVAERVENRVADCSFVTFRTDGSAAKAAPIYARRTPVKSSSRQLGGLRSRPWFVVDGDPMAEDHFSTLPAREQHDADRDERENQPKWHDRARPVAIALIEAEQLDDHQDHVADGVLPRIAERANAAIAEKIYQTGDGRCGGRHQACTEQPEGPCRKGFRAGSPEDHIE